MTVRWAITCLVASSTACFSKPDRPIAASTDAPPSAGPRVVVEKHGNNVNASTMSLMVLVPEGDALLLVASVHLGADCEETIPGVREISGDSQTLTQDTNVVGTTCGGGSRSELWTLVAPPAGEPLRLNFILDNPAPSFHAMVLVLDGVDQTDPLRATATNNGAGVDSSITIDSAPGDLVIDTIGHGSGISGPGADQDRIFTMNNSAATTLDNSGASSRSGESRVTMTWQFGASDEWQTIAASIRPR